MLFLMAVSTLHSLDSLLKHQEILYLQQSIQSEQQWRLYMAFLVLTEVFLRCGEVYMM